MRHPEYSWHLFSHFDLPRFHRKTCAQNGWIELLIQRLKLKESDVRKFSEVFKEKSEERIHTARQYGFEQLSTDQSVQTLQSKTPKLHQRLIKRCQIGNFADEFKCGVKSQEDGRWMVGSLERTVQTPFFLSMSSLPKRVEVCILRGIFILLMLTPLKTNEVNRTIAPACNLPSAAHPW